LFQIYEIRLNETDRSFSLNIANSEKNFGAFVQEILTNTLAGRTTLRKSD
ncbi:unnamed protein product, partial [Rotaria sp. Silwood2]